MGRRCRRSRAPGRGGSPRFGRSSIDRWRERLLVLLVRRILLEESLGDSLYAVHAATPRPRRIWQIRRGRTQRGFLVCGRPGLPRSGLNFIFVCLSVCVYMSISYSSAIARWSRHGRRNINKTWKSMWWREGHSRWQGHQPFLNQVTTKNHTSIAII